MRNIFRVPDLRLKILFTIAILGAYRLGSQVPVPGIDFDAILSLREQADQTGGVLALLNLFSGGALTNFAIFALGIMPYITASIIIQILTVAIPRLEQLQQQGAVGDAGAVQKLERDEHLRRRAGLVRGVWCEKRGCGRGASREQECLRVERSCLRSDGLHDGGREVRRAVEWREG